MNRGVDRQDIFSADRDHLLFEGLLGEANCRFDVAVHAYVLMSNHFHLVLHGVGEVISEFMQHLCGRYASAYNDRTCRDGPLFTTRFRHVAITDDGQLAQAARYVHRNPLTFVPRASIAAYRWSSLGVYCGRRAAPPWLSTHLLSGLIGAPAKQLEYVLRPQSSDVLAVNAPPLVPVSCVEVEEAVAVVAGVDQESLRVPTPRRPNEPRTLALTIAVEARAADHDALARRYGLSGPQAVRRIARHGRVLVAESPRFADLRRRILRHLAQAA